MTTWKETHRLSWRNGGTHPLRFGMTSDFHLLDHLSLTSPPSATHRGTEQEYWQV